MYSSIDRLRRQVGSRQLHDLRESVGVVDGDLGQHLAVDRYHRPLQPGDQLTVAQATHPAGRVDADDPQPAKIALADPAIAKRKDAGSQQGDDRLPIEVVPAGAETLRQSAETLPPAQNALAAAGACHRYCSS